MPRTPTRTAPPAKDAEIEAQAAPGKTLTRDVPLTARTRFATAVNLSPEAYVRDTNPDDIGFGTLDRMRADPTLSTALTLLETPILRQVRQATIKSDDPSVKRVLEHCLLESGLLYSAVKAQLLALAFGMQACEKIWQVEELDLTYDEDDPDTGDSTPVSAWNGPALTIKELRECNPNTVKAFRRRLPPQGSKATQDEYGKPLDGSFDGFYWNDGSLNEDAWVAPQKAFVYSHDKEFGNLWGKPRIRHAYPEYYWLQFVKKLWMHWVEKKVIPTRIMWYPTGITEYPDGTQDDNATIALSTAELIDNNTAVAFPSELLGEGRYARRAWDVEEKPTTDRTEVFHATATYLEGNELKAVFVPSRVFEQGELGSFSSTNAFQSLYLLTLDALLYDLVSNTNAYLTQPLAVAQFGTQVPHAEVVIPGMTDEERAQMDTVFTALLNNPSKQDMIDFEAILKARGIPTREAEQAPDAGGVPAFPGAADAAQPGDQGAPVAPLAGAPGAPAVPEAPTAAPAAAGGNLLLSEAAAGDVVELAEIVISLATGFDAGRWDVRPDAKSPLGYAVFDKHQNNKRLAGFAAKKVIESWQKASATAGKKAAAEQAKLARAAASAQRKNDAAAQANARRQEREAIKQQKAQEREQKQAAAEQTRQEKAAQREADRTAREQEHATAQHQSALLQQARTERSQLEITTGRQTSNQALATLQSRGWEAAGSASDRGAAEQQATQLAGSDRGHIYTVIRVKGAFLIARKPAAKFVLQAAAPNVAADDADARTESLGVLDSEASDARQDTSPGHVQPAPLWREAAARLLPHFLPPEEEPDERADEDRDESGGEGESGGE